MKFLVEVVQTVEVELDESKFDDKFLSEFREQFYALDSIDDHAKHIAQMEARGILGSNFIEGYGAPDAMGIEACVIDQYEEVERVDPELAKPREGGR